MVKYIISIIVTFILTADNIKWQGQSAARLPMHISPPSIFGKGGSPRTARGIYDGKIARQMRYYILANPKVLLTAIACEVQNSIKMMYGIEVEIKDEEIQEADAGTLLYPDMPNVGIAPHSVPGLEAAGFWGMKGRFDKANFIFPIPVLGILGDNHSKTLCAEYAVFFNREGRLVLGHFMEPLPLHAIDYGGLYDSEAGQFIYSCGVPLLSTPSAVSLSRNKAESGKLLKGAGVRTPEFIMLEADMEKGTIASAISNFMGGAGIVIKPLDSFGGIDIRMFGPQEGAAAADYAGLLLKRRGTIIVQRRILPMRWIDQTGKAMDWNLRVLSTWDGNNIVIREDMIEVRYMPFAEGPVNVGAGADVITLSDFFDRRDFSAEKRKAFMAGITKTIIPAIRRFEKQGKSDTSYPYKEGGLLGWDLVCSEEGDWYIIEVNAGSVGGCYDMERMAKTEDRGKVVIPIAAYLSDMAHRYRNTHGPKTGRIGGRMDLLDEPILMYNFAGTLMLAGKYKEAEYLYILCLDKIPEPDGWFVYRRLSICFEKQGLFRNMETVERYILKNMPDYPLTSLRLGMSLMAQWRWDDAVAALDSAVKDPLSHEVEVIWINLAICYLMAGREEDAKRAVDAVCGIVGDSGRDDILAYINRIVALAKKSHTVDNNPAQDSSA